MDINMDLNKGLQEIQDDMLSMGSMVGRSITRSIESLKKRDLNRAHQIIADDAKINEQRFKIEDKCIKLIAAQQPKVEELQTIVSVLNIIIELERIGDYAEGIAKIVIMIGDEPPLKPLIDIPRMAEMTVEMLDKSLTAFRNRDVNTARYIVTLDNQVDALNDQVFRELLTFMMVDPKTINRATRLIWVTHNLERAADRATNICERVIFMVTGKMEEMETSKY